jgi:3-oxoacyl-[acyl-carrier protein] reductase
MSDRNKRFEGKVAFITGGASGIGRGIAEKFLEEGAKVMLADINKDLLEEVKAKLGDACETAVANVTVEADLEKATLKTVECFGRLDFGVNSAGLGTYAYITEQIEEQWDLVIDTCLKGVFMSMKHEMRQMLKHDDGGAVVNIASLNSRQPAEGYSAYCSAKAGVEMMTKVAAMEMGPYKIRINAISPGGVDTPLIAGYDQNKELFAESMDNTPLGRIGTTDDIAAACLFLCSDEASWITGDTLFVDGGCQTKRYPVLSDHIPFLKQLMPEKKGE